MNSLSWFIYLTQVVDNLSAAIGIVLFVGGIAAVLVTMFIVCELGEDEVRAWLRWLRRWGLALLVSLAALTILLPNRTTMLLMAGSEIGERITKSESVTSVVDPSVDLLKAWIAKETKNLQKQTEK